MSRRKKNSAKTASKSAAEPIKEKIAEPETKSVKPTAEKKKAATKTRTTKKASTSATAKAAATDSKKRAVRKSAKAKTDEVVFQSGGKDYTLSEITEMCKDVYRGGTRKQIKSIKVYVKAEGNQLKAYYVVNDSANGSVDL